VAKRTLIDELKREWKYDKNEFFLSIFVLAIIGLIVIGLATLCFFYSKTVGIILAFFVACVAVGGVVASVIVHLCRED